MESSIKLYIDYGKRTGANSHQFLGQVNSFKEIPKGEYIVGIWAAVCTREFAEKWVKEMGFPKYCRLHVANLQGMDNYSATITFPVWCTINGTTGAVNEAAIKRRKKIFEILKNNGF